MGYLSKEAYEKKREYAIRRMAENAGIETLTDEQHEALAHLCEVRHEVHCGQDDMWNVESCGYGRMWDVIGSESEYNRSLRNIFKSVGLEVPPLLDSLLPSDNDWYEVLSEEEREAWEARAKMTEEGVFQHDGYSLWLEEGEEYSLFKKAVQQWNDDVEEYLRRIDEQHGTHYCPTGATRIY